MQHTNNRLTHIQTLSSFINTNNPVKIIFHKSKYIPILAVGINNRWPVIESLASWYPPGGNDIGDDSREFTATLGTALDAGAAVAV